MTDCGPLNRRVDEPFGDLRTSALRWRGLRLWVGQSQLRHGAEWRHYKSAAALHTSMAALRCTASVRSNRVNAGDRPEVVVPESLQQQSFEGNNAPFRSSQRACGLAFEE
jgi:hypothetical protein